MRVYCRDCKIKLTEENSSKGFRALCKNCFSIYMKKYYKSNPEKYEKHKKDFVAKNDELYQLKTRAIIASRLRDGCFDCGEKDPVVLEFDHRDPKEKEYSIFSIMKTKVPEEVFINEINKCDVVCANCHKKRTAKMFGNWKSNLAN
jgi:hypothetical protein